METKPIQQTKAITSKEFFAQDIIKNKFTEILGKRAPAFVASVLQVISTNTLFAKADPMSIFNAAAVAATLDLPINNNLGFAYIIPYGGAAQFQIGAKGFNQLAQRSGQFQTINATDVREGEIKSNNRLTGEIQFEWIQDEAERLNKKVVGYISYFKLLNGFEKPFYMSIEKLEAHGKKYSKNYSNANSLWKTDFPGMCLKTVIKLNLSKNAPLSIEMQTALKTDQAVIKNTDGTDVHYPDNATTDIDFVDVDKEEERIRAMIKDCTTIEDLELLQTSNPDIDVTLFEARKKEIGGK